MTHSARFLSTTFLVVAAALLTGCATSRDVVSPQVAKTSNPAAGTAIRIEQVVDARVFEAHPSDPSTPSLMDGQVGDAALRARAIARKRNGFGQALGDVLLPENETVSQLTRQTIAGAYREAGYRVLERGEPGHDEAIPVQVRVNKLWAWMRPGFWALSLESQHEVLIGGPSTPTPGAGQYAGKTAKGMQFITSEDWSQAVQRALDDLSQQIRSRLQNR